MGVPAYLAGLNLDPGTAARLQGMVDPPPAAPSPEITIPTTEIAGPTPGPGLNWQRAGDRLASAGTAAAGVVDKASNVFAPGASTAGKYIGEATGKAITGRDPAGSEDTGEGISPEMVEKRKEYAKNGPPALREAPDAEPNEQETLNALAATPGHYVGAQWVPTSRSSTTQHGIDASKLEPGQRLRVMGAQHGEASIEATQAAAAQEAAGDVAYAAAHAEATQQAAARQQAIENEKQAYTIREHEKLDALNTAAQQQVDPEAAKGSLGAQILAAIGVGLGTFGSSLNGGTNTALQIVNANIDRRIAAQQFNINNAHKALSNEQSLYKDNLAAFGDKERAALASKMQMIDQAKAVLDQQYAAAKSNRNEAQYHAMREGLDERYAQYADQFGIRTADQVATTGSEHYAPAHMEGGGAAAGTKGKEALFVPSLGIYARTEKEAVELRGNSARTQNTVRELTRAKEIIAEAKATNDPRKLAELQRELKGVAARAAVTATVKEGQGAMSEGDRAVSEAGLGLADINLGLLNKANPMTPSLDSGGRLIDRAMKAHQQEYGRMGAGQQRGREVYVRDPVTGKVEARQVLSGSNSADRNKVDDLSDKIEKPKGKAR